MHFENKIKTADNKDRQLEKLKDETMNKWKQKKKIMCRGATVINKKMNNNNKNGISASNM